jgi:hypothetical protein
MFNAIAATLYWGCCFFVGSDCLICEDVGINVNAGARQTLLIWIVGGGGLTLRLNIILVELKNCYKTMSLL